MTPIERVRCLSLDFKNVDTSRVNKPGNKTDELEAEFE